MFLARSMRALPLAAALIGASMFPAAASTSHYFYDAAGRYIGQTTTSAQVRSNRYDGADNRTWYLSQASNVPSSSQTLGNSQSLFQGQALVSANGVYVLGLQEDGNLVIYHGSTAIWNTGTGGTDTATLLMGSDGTLFLQDAQWNTVWSTNTTGNPGATLTMQTDGNLVLYSTAGVALWSSGTYGR